MPNKHFAGFHRFGGVERCLAFEVAQLPEEPPGTVHPDHAPEARVVCGADGDLAGQNDEEIVRALSLPDQYLSRLHRAAVAARLKRGDLIIRQSRVCAVHVRSLSQRT